MDLARLEDEPSLLARVRAVVEFGRAHPAPPELVAEMQGVLWRWDELKARFGPDPSPLYALLEHPDETVAGHVGDVLARLDHPHTLYALLALAGAPATEAADKARDALDARREQLEVSRAWAVELVTGGTASRVRSLGVRLFARALAADDLETLVGWVADPDRDVATAALREVRRLCDQDRAVAAAAVPTLLATAALERAVELDALAVERVALALAQVGGPGAIAPLTAILAGRASYRAREIAGQALAALPGDAALPALATATDVHAVWAALERIGERAVDAVLAAFPAARSPVSALQCLESIGAGARAVPLLRGLLAAPDAEIRDAAAAWLGRMGHAEVAPALVEAVRRGALSVDTFLASLIACGAAAAAETLLAAVEDADEKVRLAAVVGLGRIGDGHVIVPLHAALRADRSIHVRHAAAYALAGVVGGREALDDARCDPDATVAFLARAALGLDPPPGAATCPLCGRDELEPAGFVFVHRSDVYTSDFEVEREARTSCRACGTTYVVNGGEYLSVSTFVVGYVKRDGRWRQSL